MKQPISVIIPSRGDSPFLRAAIASAAAADAAEIVVALPEPIEPLPECSVPLRQVGVTIRRCSVGRNAAIAAARHARVALLDDDDLFLSNHLRTIDALFEEYPDAPFVATRAGYFDDNSAVGNAAPPETPEGDFYPPPSIGPRVGLADLLLANRFAAPAVVVDRDRLRTGSLRFDEARPVMEDYDMWCTLAEQGAAALSQEVGILVRRRPQSDSSDVRGMARHSLDILSRYASRIETIGVDPEAWRQRQAALWHDLAWGELAYGSGADCRRALDESRRLGAEPTHPVLYSLVSRLPVAIRRMWIGSRETR